MPKVTSLGLLVLPLVGCGEPCEVSSLSPVFPQEQQDPTSRSVVLEVQGIGEGEPVFQLTDASGSDVAGTTHIAEDSATYTPDALLDPEASYSWNVQVCDSSIDGTFTTGVHGETMDPATLVDKAYGIDLSEGTWLEPAGGEALLSMLFEGVLLLGVEAGTADSIDMIAAVGEVVDEEWIQQDPCFATADFEPTSFNNNPYAEVGPLEIEVEVEGIPVTLEQVNIRGAFTTDGETLSDGELSAEADVRAFGNGDGWCDLLVSYGLTCRSCTVDGEPYCLGLHVVDLEADRVQGLRVVPNEDPQECSTDDDPREDEDGEEASR